MTRLYYHANCQDGMAAAGLMLMFGSIAQDATLAAKALMAKAGRLELVPYTHGVTRPEDCRPDSIWVDCLPPEGLPALLVLDHHPAARNHSLGREHYCPQLSGAGMVWRFLYGTAPMPRWLQLVQEYDLSGGQGPGSEEIQAFIEGFLAFMDGNPENLRGVMLDSPSVSRIIEAGKMLGVHTRNLMNDAPRMDLRDLTLILGSRSFAKFVPLNDGRLYLFAYGDGFVSCRGPGARRLAEFFGGGGHEEAAGFKMDVKDVVTFFNDGTFHISSGRES